MKLNESDIPQSSLIKAYKALSKLKCISDFPRASKCRLITFNKFNNICKHYNDFSFLADQTKLIESREDFIYQMKPYNLKGIKKFNISAGCQVSSLIILPDEFMATGCRDGTIKIWNTANWSCTFSIKNETYINSFAIFQNKYLASGGNGNIIKIWDYLNGKLISTFANHTGSIKGVIQLQNGDIASASWDRTTKIWSTNGTIKLTLNETPNRVNGLVQLRNGNLVTVSWGKFIRLWNPYTGVLLNSMNTSDIPSAAIQLKNDDLFIGTDSVYGKGLIIYDSITLELKYTFPGTNNRINGIVQLQNDDLASCSLSDFKVRVWDCNSKSLKYELIGHTDSVFAVAELPNGYLASAGKDSQIIIWE